MATAKGEPMPTTATTGSDPHTTMPGIPALVTMLTDDDLAAIDARLSADSSLTIAAVARELGVRRRRLSERVNDYRAGYRANGHVGGANGTDGATPTPALPARERVSWTGQADGGAAIESPKSSSIRTLDGLLSAAAVDLDRWSVIRHVINRWEVGVSDRAGGVNVEGLWQVKAWLEPRVAVNDTREVIAALIEDMKAYVPPAMPTVIPLDTDARHMLELDPYDVHIGLLAWAAESGEDYDSVIAERLIDAAIADLIALSQAFRFSRVLIPIGGDFIHTDKMIDGKGGTTQRGTIQDVDSRRPKMIHTAIRIAMAIIDRASLVAPIVEVLPIGGNHDAETMLMLAEVLAARYHNADNIIIRVDPAPRQYVRYGTTLLGFCHGHNEKPDKLPLIMASEEPDAWAATTHHEWHAGHLHRLSVDGAAEHGGVRVRVLPSIAARDAWHAQQGYQHKRAMQCFVWHETIGYRGHFETTPLAIDALR